MKDARAKKIFSLSSRIQHLSPIIYPIASGILYALSFPRIDFPFLAWIALVPLLIGIRNVTPRRAFLMGWLAGGVAFLGLLYWVTITMEQYGKVPWPATLPILFLLVAYMGLYLAGFSALLVWIRLKMDVPGVLLIPVIWTVLEWVRAHALTGFPWVLLGYSQYRNLPMIQIADLTGVYGVSALIALVNAAIADGLRILDPSRRRRAFISLFVAALSLGLTWSYGAFRLSENAHASSRSLRVGLVQGNIPQDVKWDTRFRQATLQRYAQLTHRIAQGGLALDTAPPLTRPIPPQSGGPPSPSHGEGTRLRADESRVPRTEVRDPPEADALSQGLDLAVWPEAAMPFVFEDDLFFNQQVISLVQREQTPLLFGSPARSSDSKLSLSNSAYLLDASGHVVSRYDKIHLVPFGEYVPLSSILFFINKMVEGIGDFAPGKDYTIFSFPLTTHSASGGSQLTTPFGVVICFEVIFPELVRRFVQEGADMMITITNDAWFGRSSAPYQHFSMVVFRSVENRVPFVRAANTGISGFIEVSGRIRQTTDLFTEAALTDTVRISGRRTLYTRLGDLFADVCGIITLVFVLFRIRISKQPAIGETSHAGRI